MKFILVAFAIAVLAIKSSQSAVAKDLIVKAKAAAHKCRAENNVDEAAFLDLVKNKKVPEKENEKCMVACYFKGMGYYHDGKYDTAVIEESNAMKWDDAEIVAKANEVAKYCVSEVGSEEKECESAAKMVKCLMAEGKKKGVPFPEVPH